MPVRSRRSDEEPTFGESVTAGVDVIAASGDKLLGGPQAGLIFGRRDIMKSTAAIRWPAPFVSRLTYAALEATLLDYAAGSESAIPVIRMMNLGPDEILRRAEALAAAVSQRCLTVSIQPGHSVIGGGAAPGTKLRTHLLRIAHRTQSVSMLVKALRDSSPAFVARSRGEGSCPAGSCVPLRPSSMPSSRRHFERLSGHGQPTVIVTGRIGLRWRRRSPLPAPTLDSAAAKPARAPAEHGHRQNQQRGRIGVKAVEAPAHQQRTQRPGHAYAVNA